LTALITVVITYYCCKKTLGGDKKLRAGSSKAEPKNFAPPQTPFRRYGTSKI